MTFNELARKRYSCRKLAAKPVEQEKLDVVSIFPVGYADPAAKPSPLHTTRKSAAELVAII